MPSNTYTVRSGDTLSAIAKAHRTTWQELQKLNNLANVNALHPGQILILSQADDEAAPPAGGSDYTVQPGDTLGAIAARFGIDVATLAAHNGIANPDRIGLGTRLRIPGAASGPVRPLPDRRRFPLGVLSAKYETSNRGPGTVSTGAGDPGGISYGSYQLATNRGRPKEFLAREGARWAAEFGGAAPGTPAFGKVWKAIAVREPDAFQEAQHAYIKRTHYDVQVSRVLAKSGVDLETRSDAVRNAVWSTAVQHGDSTDAVVNAIGGRRDIDDRTLLDAIYKERGRRRADGKLAYFTKARADVQASVAKRFRDELRDALAMLDAERAQPAVVAVPVTATVPPPAPAALPASDDWAAIVAARGDPEAQADFAAGRPLVIALRKPTNARVNSGRGRYDDRMIVVRRLAAGLEVSEFRGNTEPSAQYAPGGDRKTMGRDVDGDGIKDPGRLLAGCYRYQRAEAGASPVGGICFRSLRVQPSERDTNHDGSHTPADRNRLDPTGAGRSMLIHRGGDTNTFSAGCQTIPRSRFGEFVKALNGHTAFSYILVDLPG